MLDESPVVHHLRHACVRSNEHRPVRCRIGIRRAIERPAELEIVELLLEAERARDFPETAGAAQLLRREETVCRLLAKPGVQRSGAVDGGLQIRPRPGLEDGGQIRARILVGRFQHQVHCRRRIQLRIAAIEHPEKRSAVPGRFDAVGREDHPANSGRIRLGSRLIEGGELVELRRRGERGLQRLSAFVREKTGAGARFPGQCRWKRTRLGSRIPACRLRPIPRHPALVKEHTDHRTDQQRGETCQQRFHPTQKRSVYCTW